MLKSYKYFFNGLDCPNCAKKIENKISADKRFRDVVVNFSMLTINFKTSLESPFDIVEKLVKDIEPNVSLYEEKIEEDNKKDLEIIRLILAIICLLLVVFIPFKVFKKIFLILSYLLLLYKTCVKALLKIKNAHAIDENLLVTASAIGAYLLGEHMEGLMVIMLYVIGKILEDKAVNHSRHSIKELLDLKVDTANLKENDKITVVKSQELKLNDVIIVRKGELIPVDGEVVLGSTKLDASSLTGEAILTSIGVGDKVLSGSINTGDVIEVKVTHTYQNSTAYKILELTMNATNNKAKMETRVSKIANIYTPAVLIIAIIIGIFLPLIIHVSYKDAIYRALTFLVISCPCAMAISVPLSYFAGIGVSSKNKILVKGSNYLEMVSRCSAVVFDKTGTLTSGVVCLDNIRIYNKKYTKDEVLNLIALGESFSVHPIAKLILNEISGKLDVKSVKDFREIEGKGITYKVGKNEIKVGSNSFCNTKLKENVFLVVDDELVASLTFKDNVKENAGEIINNLKKKDIKTIMLTGDNEAFAKIVADKVGIDEYHAELLPDQKYKFLKELKNEKHVLFVGDGVNDTPSLALADVGISMGDIGSNSAIEASDIVIMNDDLSNIGKLFKISKKTNRIINFNLIFAIGIKILILILATLGLVSMWAAVFADTGLTLLTILNSLRILKN